MIALASGMPLPDSAKIAIVRDIATLILNNCKYPTMSQVGVVASKLVKQYNHLEDTLGTGHVSILHKIWILHVIVLFLHNITVMQNAFIVCMYNTCMLEHSYEGLCSSGSSTLFSRL